MNYPLHYTMHRPYKMPANRWIMQQTWRYLLFASWPVSAHELLPFLPSSLKLDQFNHTAWISIVPFHMDRVQFRGLPKFPFLSSFPQINVRTYVTLNNKPGIYLFSLDVTKRIIAMAAKKFFYLPYFHAQISMHRQNDVIHFTSIRNKTNLFEVIYTPDSNPYHPESGTLEHWLTERYCLYSVDHNQHLYRGEIHHPPWTLQNANAVLQKNSLINALGISPMDNLPLFHYASKQDVLIWNIQPIKKFVE